MKSKFVIRICSILLMSGTFCNALKSQTLQVYPSAIYFNYDTENNTEDALTILDNGASTSSPEFYIDQQSDPAAYIMGQSSRKIRVEFEDENYYEITAHLLVTITKSGGAGDAIGTVCNIFIPNYPLGSWEERTIQLTGDLPNAVGKHEFEWEWEIYAIPVNEPGFSAGWNTSNTEHTYYTILAAPHAPMSQPWISVLDYACEWASGQSTISNCSQKVVEGLYNSTDFLYDTYSGVSKYTSYGTGSFDLSTMLSDIGGENIVVNCYDMGKALKIFGNSLGCDLEYVLSYPFGYLNCIKAIGRGWANNPFYSNPYINSNPIVDEDDDDSNGRSMFGNHAFCRISTTYYDACLKVDTDTNPDAAPHIESWAYGWSWTTYKGKVVDNNPSISTGTPIPYNFSVY